MLAKIKSYYESKREQFDNIVNKLDYAILILYGLFVFEAFLRSTTFVINWNPLYHFSLKLILIFLVFSKSLFKFVDNIPLYLILGFSSIGFLLAYLQGNHGILLELILFTIALIDIDYKKLITTFTIIISISLFIVFLASQTDIINNLIYTTANNSTRISFGIHYPTNFASYILYLCLAWGFIREKRTSYIEILIMFLLAIFVYYFCAARTSTACIILFSLLMLLHKRFQKQPLKKSKNFFANLGVFAVPLCALLSILLSYFYKPNHTLFTKIDSLLSNRLYYGNKALTEYDILLFGQNIKMEGNGGYSIPWCNNYDYGKSGYNFIDSSYVSILMRYGLFVFICVIILFTLTSYVAKKTKDYVTLAIVSIIAIHCIMEHHMLDFNYNPFMFLLVSSYYNKYKHINKTGEVMS